MPWFSPRTGESFPEVLTEPCACGTWQRAKSCENSPRRVVRFSVWLVLLVVFWPWPGKPGAGESEKEERSGSGMWKPAKRFAIWKAMMGLSIVSHFLLMAGVPCPVVVLVFPPFLIQPRLLRSRITPCAYGTSLPVRSSLDLGSTARA